jgi:hypothetical protein
MGHFTNGADDERVGEIIQYEGGTDDERVGSKKKR